MHTRNANSAQLQDMTILATALFGLVLLGCGGSDKKGGQSRSGPCTRAELQGCGAACASDTACEAGLHCGSEKTCTAQCTAESSLVDCGESNACSAVGECTNMSVGDGDGDSSGDGDSNSCAKVNVAAHPTTPNVILIIDQSSSMGEDLGGVSRWQALKNVLLGDEGLIAELESQVRFGLYLYSSKDFDIECPALTIVPASLDNLEAITEVYSPASMIEDTPTGDAINAITDMLAGGFNDQGGGDQTIFILATDGEPDTCAQPDPQRGQQHAIDAVKRAFDEGFKTFVLAVSEDNQQGISSGHAQDLANTGTGKPLVPYRDCEDAPDPATCAPFYRVDSVKKLENSLREIVSGQLDCVMRLDGSFPEEVKGACDAQGTITLNGQDLTCETDWVIVERSVIEIKGAACDKLKQPGASFSASFACGGIDLF